MAAKILGCCLLYLAARVYRNRVPIAVERSIGADAVAAEEAVDDIEDCLELVGDPDEPEVPARSKVKPGKLQPLVAACVVALKLKFGGASGYMPEDSPAVRRAAFEWIQRRLKQEHETLRDCDMRRIIMRAVPQMWIEDEIDIYSSRVGRSFCRAIRNGSLIIPFDLLAKLMFGTKPSGVILE